MTELSKFERVKQILDTAVNGENLGAHGAFWRDLTRDEFVKVKIFGQQLLIVGNCEESNLVDALRGTGKFAGVPYRRMPGGRNPVSEHDIEFICRWINDGCLDDDSEIVDPQAHNAYWRDFDNWAMLDVDKVPAELDAMNSFMGEAAILWMIYAQDNGKEQDWVAAINAAAMKRALSLLSTRQIQIVQEHYGNPVVWQNVFDSYEKFGDDSLPDDPLRPDDRRHNMDGPNMWFMWSAFADACLRLEIDIEFWKNAVRAILLGLMNDGLFRGRFQVQDFSADEVGKKAMREHVQSIANDELHDELVKRYNGSGFQVSI